MIECKGALTRAMIDDGADRTDGCMPGVWTGPRDQMAMADATQAIASAVWRHGFRPDHVIAHEDGKVEVLLDPAYTAEQS